MDFGVVASSFSNYRWPEFLQALRHLGVEALELDSQPNARSNNWMPETDPAVVVEDLKAMGLRVGAVFAAVDFVQTDPDPLKREIEAAKAFTDLSFQYRSEIVHLSPQHPRVGMTREAMIASIERGCAALLEHAEEYGILICLSPDAELLRDADTIRSLIHRSGSYNLRATLDTLRWLRAFKDPEMVRSTAADLLEYAGHVILQDGRVDGASGIVVELPLST